MRGAQATKQSGGAAVWLRFYTTEGHLVLLLAEAERERAERLAARLRALGLEPDEEADP